MAKQFHAVAIYEEHYKILYTGNDREMIRDWFLIHPDAIGSGALLVTEPHTAAKTYDCEVEMLQPGIMDQGRFVASERKMTKTQALMWAEEQGRKHAHHVLTECSVTRGHWLYAAASRGDLKAGKRVAIFLRPVAVFFNELPN